MAKQGLRLLLQPPLKSIRGSAVARGFGDRRVKKADRQQKLYLKEPCILVDENDNERGSASKLDCHTLENVKAGGHLHRAFSVFLFNDKKELLLQKRAKSKITFPEVWTNTCCSHPLYTDTERETENAIGVKRAAQRKLQHELGFTKEQVPADKMICTARILYQAESDDDWGEHELDYCLIVRSDAKPKPNRNEVEDAEYVDTVILREMLSAPMVIFSPWFRLIAKDLLWNWWHDLDRLEKDTHQKEILKFQ